MIELKPEEVDFWKACVIARIQSGHESPIAWADECVLELRKRTADPHPGLRGVKGP